MKNRNRLDIVILISLFLATSLAYATPNREFEGSEAEALLEGFFNRIETNWWQDSISIRSGDTVKTYGIETPPSCALDRTYLIRDQKLIDNIQKVRSKPPQNDELLLTEKKIMSLPESLREQVLLLTLSKDLIEIKTGNVSKGFEPRLISEEQKNTIDRLTQAINHTIDALNKTTPDGYYFNSKHVNPRYTTQYISLFSSQYDYDQMDILLAAIQQDDEKAFLESMVNLATSFPKGTTPEENTIQAKVGFIHSFTHLYVTKNFPSEGIFLNYAHDILRCGILR